MEKDNRSTDGVEKATAALDFRKLIAKLRQNYELANNGRNHRQRYRAARLAEYRNRFSSVKWMLI